MNGVLAPSLIGESLFEQERHRRGGAIEVQFKPTRDITIGASAFSSKVDDTNMNTNFMASPKWLLQAGIAPTSLEIVLGVVERVNQARPSFTHLSVNDCNRPA